jgi:hypothetical protein
MKDEVGMKRSILVAALLALAACQSATGLNEGERLSWACDGGKEISLRNVSNAVEVFAAGQTYRLDPVNGAEHQYSNGAVTYAEASGRATLRGAYGGPYENCQRRRSDWWFDFW